MAPERAMGQEVRPWSDLYSVGVMAFEMLVGHTPFQTPRSRWRS
jgi:serine/threonine protein kinase